MVRSTPCHPFDTIRFVVFCGAHTNLRSWSSPTTANRFTAPFRYVLHLVDLLLISSFDYFTTETFCSFLPSLHRSAAHICISGIRIRVTWLATVGTFPLHCLHWKGIHTIIHAPPQVNGELGLPIFALTGKSTFFQLCRRVQESNLNLKMHISIIVCLNFLVLTVFVIPWQSRPLLTFVPTCNWWFWLIRLAF